MKKTNRSQFCGYNAVKMVVSVIAMSASIACFAEFKWMLVTDSGEKMPVGDVECLVSTDVSDNFTIVGSETTIAEVKSISFSNGESGGVETIVSDDAGNLVIADKYLCLSGLKSCVDVAVLTTDGKQVSFKHVGPADATVDTEALLPGVYVLSVSRDGHSRSVKFVKK